MATDRVVPDSLGERFARGDASIFTELVQELAVAITVRDTDGRIVYANPAALAHLGMESLDELRSRAGPSIIEEYLVEDERGQPLTLDDVPSVRLLRGRRAAPVLMRVVNRSTGELRWNLLKATALRDDHDRIVGVMTVIENMTAVKEAEIRTRVLAESGRILASSLDYQQTLSNVAEIAVPSLADYCAVDLLGERGQIERVAVTHHNPAREPLVDQLRALTPDGRESIGAAARVQLTGTSELYSDVTDEQLVAIARDQRHLELLREAAPRSVLIVALRVAARTIGVMTLGTDVSRRRLTDQHVELAEQLARRAAVAVENSRLHTQLASVAATLQQSLVPADPPAVPGWEIAALYRPAQIEQRIDVGGDFYEFFDHDGTWFVIFGDMSGKGVTAASLTTLMRHGARVASRSNPAPAAILAGLDEALAQQAGDALCTALCMSLHDGHIVLSSAGHPPAMIVSADGTVREVPAPGPLLGAFPDSTWPQETVAVGPGELLVLYTDGVTETPGERDRFGVERLGELLGRLAGQRPELVLEQLDAALDAFAGEAGRDDLAVLALRPRPGPR